MPPIPPADTPSALLEDPIARDLAWLLDTPDLVALKGYPGRPTRAELGLESDAHDWLERLLPACRAVVKKRLTRMGHYHETLWHLLLGHAPNTRLLAHNVQIREKRLTLGELDMLYRTCADPAPIHLEVAIKFYLGLDEGPSGATSQNRWIGPGGLDSLGRKCAHLHAHQLPLSATPLAQKTLNHWLAPRDCAPFEPGAGALTQRLAMPGVLFYPFHATLPPPEGTSAHHRRGQWCYLKDWETLLAREGEVKMAWLKKPFWLAPPLETAFDSPKAFGPALTAHIAQYGPQQVMLKAEGGAALKRVFIVPNDWPRQIPLPLGSSKTRPGR
ncbi:DUF1853 family protein [Vreelandella sp. EE27]